MDEFSWSFLPPPLALAGTIHYFTGANREKGEAAPISLRHTLDSLGHHLVINLDAMKSGPYWIPSLCSLCFLLFNCIVPATTGTDVHRYTLSPAKEGLLCTRPFGITGRKT